MGCQEVVYSPGFPRALMAQTMAGEPPPFVPRHAGQQGHAILTHGQAAGDASDNEE
jgi:hypothetical protein